MMRGLENSVALPVAVAGLGSVPSQSGVLVWAAHGASGRLVGPPLQV